MSTDSRTLVTVVAVAFLAVLIPESSAQVKLQVTGSTEFPSLKCVIRPEQFDFDIKNKQLCFCVWVQNVIPTYNCIKAAGNVTIDDLKMIRDMIRNATNLLRPSTTTTSTTPQPENPSEPNQPTEPVPVTESSRNELFNIPFPSLSNIFGKRQVIPVQVESQNLNDEVDRQPEDEISLTR